MPRVSTKTTPTKTTRTKTSAAHSWLEGAAAKPVKAKAPAKKKAAAPAKAARKPATKVVAKKRVVRRTRKTAVTPVKAIRTKLGRTELLTHLAETSGQEKAAVKAVLEAFKTTMLAHLAPRGAGEFVMPGMFKVVTKKVAAKKVAGIKAGTEVRNPRTGEMYAHAGRKAYTKPATVKVRVRPMKAMKDVAIGV